MKSKDLTDKRFGRLIVRCRTNRMSGGHYYWVCDCDCGETTEVLGSALTRKNRNTTSCRKCIAKAISVRNTKHFGCIQCGNDKHYAKGLCRNCYERRRRYERSITNG